MGNEVEEIKQRTDIVAVISQYTALTKAGRTLRGLCPFHSEKHGSFFVYPEQQSWHCFGACATGGDVFSFIMKKEGLDFRAALEMLAERAGVALPSRTSPQEKDRKERLFQVTQAAAAFYHQQLQESEQAEKARGYLGTRGVNGASIEAFQLGYSPAGWHGLYDNLKARGYSDEEMQAVALVAKSADGRLHDRFRDMLMFPICDARGRVAGFGARVLGDSLPKYINSAQSAIFDKSSLLYAGSQASQPIRETGTVTIVEGYFDAIICHQYGFANTVASMGVALTEKQLTALSKLTGSVTLALDADSAGEEATLRAVDYERTLGTELRVAVPSGGRDPDEVILESPEAWQAVLDAAVPIVDFKFEQVARGLDLTRAKGKAALVESLLPIIARMADVVRQGHYVQKLAHLSGTSEQRLETLLIKEIRKPQTTRKQDALTAAATDGEPVSPLEDSCLAALIKHPELSPICARLEPECFELAENRAIFTAWLLGAERLTEGLDAGLQTRLERLLTQPAPDDNMDMRLSEIYLRLRERHLRRLKQQEEMAAEARAEMTAEERAGLERQAIAINNDLADVFAQKKKRRVPRR